MSEKRQRINATGKTEEEKQQSRKETEKKNNEKKKALYDRKNIFAPQNRKLSNRITLAAARAGITENQYIIEAVENRLTLDGYPAPAEKEETPQE